jgi:Recombination endonuclease VII
MNAKEWHEQNKPWVDEYKKSYYEENKEKIKARSMARYLANKEEINLKRKNRYRGSPKVREEFRGYGLIRVGWTLEKYQEAFSIQQEKCAICGKTSERRLNADHDHLTGATRELLCMICNMMLGNAKDSPTLLEKAAAYLRKHGKK